MHTSTPNEFTTESSQSEFAEICEELGIPHPSFDASTQEIELPFTEEQIFRSMARVDARPEIQELLDFVLESPLNTRIK